MNRILKKFNSLGIRTAPIDYTGVTPGLAVTPADMLFNSEHGIPIKSQIDDSQFYDGDTSMSMDISPEHIRGYDIVDAWNDQLDAKNKFSRARKNDIKSYGE